MPDKDEKRTDWDLEYGPDRDPTGFRTLAIFFDNSDPDRRAEVSIATQTLGQIGTLPEALEVRKHYAIDVLRAMLEEFERGHEIRSGELTRIGKDDVDMRLVKSRFTASQEPSL